MKTCNCGPDDVCMACFPTGMSPTEYSLWLTRRTLRSAASFRTSTVIKPQAPPPPDLAAVLRASGEPVQPAPNVGRSSNGAPEPPDLIALIQSARGGVR